MHDLGESNRHARTSRLGAMLSLLVITLTGASDPSELIDLLGSDRPAERRASAAALEGLGLEALPTLREARFSSNDLELRARVAAVLDKVEGRRLLVPTPVLLDFRDRPLSEVIEELGDRTGMPLLLAEVDAKRLTRPITLESNEPIPFLEAVERLCLAVSLRVVTEQDLFQMRQRFGFMGMQGERRRRPRTGLELVLMPAIGGEPAPSSLHGSIRVSVLSISLHRNRILSPQQLPPDALPKAESRPRQATGDRFQIVLQIQGEPRLTVATDNRRLTLTEATDDRGRSLLPETDPQASSRPTGEMFGDSGMRRGPIAIDLTYPEEPLGTAIRLLKGSITLTVAGPEPEPLVIPLEDAAGKVHRAGQSTLTIDSVEPAQDGNGSKISVTLRAHQLSGPGQPSWPSQVPMQLQRPTGASVVLYEVLDDEGRLLTATQSNYHSHHSSGMSLGITVQPIEGLGPPTTLRCSLPTFTTVEIPFAFENIPMP